MPSPAHFSVFATLRALLSRRPRLAALLTATAFLSTASPSFAAGLTLSPTSLPAGEVGVAYEQTITASGSFNALYFSIGSGALPDGLSLHSSFGTIWGTPTTTGTFNFSVYVDDGMNASGTQSYSITIAAAPPTLSINDVTLAEGDSGTTAFTFTVSLSAPAPTGGVTFDIATADGTAAAGSDYTAKSLTSQTIAAGDSSYTFTVLVSGDTSLESNETFFVNVTNVIGATVVDGQGTGTIANDEAAADLSVSISVPASVPVAGNLDYTITVTNTGPSSAASVAVAHTPLGGTSFVSASPSSGAFDPGTGAWTVGTLTSGESATLSLTVNASNAVAGGTLKPSAIVSSATSDPASGNNTASATVSVLSTNANLSAFALSSGTLDPTFEFSETSYTATVGNSVSSLTVTPNAVGTGATITVNGFTVTSGTASEPIALDVGDNTITTVVTAADGTTTKTYTVVVTRAAALAADLEVEVTASPASVTSGSRVTCTVILENNGNTTAANTRLSLFLPTGMSIVSFVAPPGWSASTNSNGMASTVQATTSALAADQRVAFRLIASVDASYSNGASLILDATASSDTEENNPADNQATAPVTFAPAADLKLSVTPPAAGSLLPGTTATYTLTLTNHGPMDAETVAVFAKVSGRGELSSSTPAGGWNTADLTFDANDIFFTGSLASGESVSHVVSISVPDDVPARAGVELYVVAASIGTADANMADNTLTHRAIVGASLVPENAQPLGNLAAGTRVTDNLYPVGAIDLYSFTAQSGDRFYAATATTASSAVDEASRDTVLTLVTSDGSTVLELDDDDGALSSTSSSLAGVPLPTSGTYYLLISCQRPQQVVFPYDLYVRLQSGTPASETAATASTPGQTLSGARWASGNLQNGTEIDTYNVTLNAGDTIFASLDLDPARTGNGWDGRLSLNPVSNPSRRFAINGSDAHRIHEPDDDTPPGSEALLLTVKDAGDYSLAVSSVDGNHGPYHLSVSVIPAATENTATTYNATISNNAIADGGTLTSTLTIPAAQRIGKLKIALNLTHANPPDLDVHLTAPGGNTVGLFRDVSDSAHTTLDVILDDDAAYAIGFDQEDEDNPLPEVAGAIFKPGRDYRLAWFAGQQAEGDWTLTIRDRNADGQAGTLNSWSLIVVADDELPSGTKTEHFSTDFESDNGGFAPSPENDPNQWQYGTSLNELITGAHSGTKVWKTNIKANYDSWSSQDLLSPAIDLSGVLSGDAIVLSWAMSYQLGDASRDGAFVEVQEVGGSNLSRIVWRWLGSAMRDTNVGYDGETIQESAGWGLHRADLSDFAGKTVRVRFHLDRTSNDTFAGLAIDDVSVASYHEEPPTVVSVVRHHNAPATTAAGTLMYRVQFSKNVENVTVASFELTNTSGDASGTISSVAGSGSVYYVTVTGVTGDGTLRLDVLGGGITDESGLALADDFTTGQTYARTAHARAYAWGSNSGGKLGDGTEFSREFPAFVRADTASALAGKTVAALAHGGEHTLALDSNGKVYAWGNNTQHQLGDGSDDAVVTLPVAVSTTGALAGKTLVAIAAGYVHSLALDTEGRVYSWGFNQNGELGLGSTAENIGDPTQVGGLLSGKTIVAIAAGLYHSLALAADGSLYAWGDAGEGQLGNGIFGEDSHVPVAVKMDGALAGKTIVAISAGVYHNLVLASDGTAYAWGWNSMGQLGYGSYFGMSEPIAVNVGSSSALEGKSLVAIAAGGEHSLALDADGKVYAWGFNISGQLGNENGPGPHYLPLAVDLPSEVTTISITAGDRHSLALTSDGVLYGWGSSGNGQLGNGSWDDSSSPVLIDTSDASALQGATVLALGSGGGLTDYALVIGSTSRPVIEAVTTPETRAYKVGSTLVFELTTDRAVSVNTTGGTPRLVLFFEGGEVYADYVSTSVDGKTLRFAYTVKEDDGSSFGIGLRPYLDLNGASIVDAADGNLDLTPAFLASNLEDVVIDAVAPAIRSIARAGGAAPATGLATVAFNVSFSEAVTSEGAELSVHNFSLVASDVTGRVSDVRLVVDGGNGRASRKAAKGKSQAPVTVYRVTVVDLAGEGEFKLALNSTRPIHDVAGNLLTGSIVSQTYTRFERATAFTWGKGDDGQLGNGASETSDVPIALSANGALLGKTVAALANGANHTLALTSDGKVFGWGSNLDGQLAIEDDATAEPVAISPTGALNGKFVVAIAAGDRFSVALTADGEVITWGRNDTGQLGIDSEDEFNVVPTLVDLADFGDSEAPRIAAISAGAQHVLALAENGNVFAWGANDQGQLGNEDTSTSERAPVFAYVFTPTAAISAGANHSLALTFEGEVLSWGGNETGQLGDGSTNNREWADPVQFSTLDADEEPTDAIASIAAGHGYSLALTADGRLFAWGANDTGQLGSNNSDNRSEPTHISLRDDVRLATLTPGRHHVLAFATDGTVYGWGDNTQRQLALPDDELFRRPIRLELTGVARAYVLGSGVSADHSTLLGITLPSHHSADTNQNWSLSLLELTRVIELYNTRDGTIRTGSYHSESGTEDGFAAGVGTIARHHSADTNQDGRLGLLELTRVIELYNTRDGTTRTGAYHRSEFATEDGFAPGPAAKQ